jgi:glycosyltransferase involved in cell wall biosynthesis
MTSPVRVLELRSVRGTGGGPDKTILLGAALRQSSAATTVCYIRDARDRIFALDRKAKELDLDYVEVWERHSFDPGIWAPLQRLVRDRHIQIVHAHEHKSAFLAWMLGRSSPIIPMATAHGWSGDSRKELAYYACEKRILARLPHVIAVSDHIAGELVRTGARLGNVTVVQNGIDHRAFVRTPGRRDAVRRAFGFESSDLVVGAVGRLESEKRFDLLIDAFNVLRPRWPSSRLLIAGDGGLRAPLETHITNSGLQQACTLLGQRSDVADLHHAFDVFVQSSEREGSPNSVLEAMALETPLVATDVGGTSSLVSDGAHGLIVPAHDPGSLAAAIERVFLDPDAARRRSSAGRRRIEAELSFDRRMERVESIYERLVGDAGATQWISGQCRVGRLG